MIKCFKIKICTFCLVFMSYNFIHEGMLAGYIKQTQLVKRKFYDRLEVKYNKTMNDKTIAM